MSSLQMIKMLRLLRESISKVQVPVQRRGGGVGVTPFEHLTCALAQGLRVLGTIGLGD